MRSIIVLQQPIKDRPEYDAVTHRIVPEAQDIATWADHTRRLIMENLALPEDFIVDHLQKCSTPPTKGGKNPSWEMRQAINKLRHTFGVDYIVY